MKLNIISEHPHQFALALASMLRLAGTVNVLTDGEYSRLLFDGTDEGQERDGICFNAKGEFDYEISLHPNARECDYRIMVVRPVYLELLRMGRGLVESAAFMEPMGRNIIVMEQVPVGLKFGHKLAASSLGLPPDTEHYEIPLDEHDLLAECCFGMDTSFSHEKLSKGYQAVLLTVYNSLHGSSYTKLKQLKSNGIRLMNKPKEVI